jgi:hypothetical protein
MLQSAERSIKSGFDIHAVLTDPAIRNFVGLAENSWNFNAPSDVPGFGPLLPTDDVEGLLAHALGHAPLVSIR